MKKAIVYASATGNTKELAQTIYSTLGEEIYCGKISDEALDADMIFLGSWTMGFTCAPDAKAFAEKLNGKKVFLFMTAGYNNTAEYFEPIMKAFKDNLNSTNEIVGEFICQGKVSDAKKKNMMDTDMAKYEKFANGIEVSQTHPDENDLAALKQKISALK